MPSALAHSRKMANRIRGVESITLNGITTVLLAVLLGLAIFVNRGKPILVPLPNAAQRNPGWSTVDGVDPATWNVAVVVIGTAVGIMASIAVTSYDAFLSRIELASVRGIPAIFLRPLTTKRALDQFITAKGRLSLSPERTALVLMLLATTLTSATTVALFSAQTVFEDVTNSSPSFPLSLLNSSYVRQRADGAVFPIGVPSMQTNTLGPTLSSFMYRSAFINGQIAKLGYRVQIPNPSDAVVPEDDPLGATSYNTLWTSGVGINAKSYLSYQGASDHFVAPANYTFVSLHGTVFGTIVNVTCTNQTANYALTQIIRTGTDVWLTTAARIGQDRFDRNITVISNTVGGGGVFEGTLAAASNITLPTGGNSNSARNMAEPVHVFLVAGFSNMEGTVFECRYSGREILVDVSIDGPDQPLVVDTASIDDGPPIGPSVKRLLAYSLDSIIGGANGGGGVLAKGFRDSKYNLDAENLTDFGDVLGTVLSQSAQAVMSSMRQMVETVAVYDPPVIEGAQVTVRISVLRLGGGPYLYGWLAVYVLLLVGSIGGLMRGWVGGRAVGFEAQDAAILLAKAAGNDGLTPAAKVQFVEGMGLVWEGKPLAGPLRGTQVSDTGQVKEVNDGEETAVGESKGK
ncbi:hypothetical protein B0T18DRAFT_414067 [Schizothecium vesticola]|uniref:Uncharacterized protein n=1 Tax=Schizothecium vesticola TaxID=314040 RepID=A0AA40EP53_9PEZI|nr:hypothetical protein B0T18DRAFT_414067 [Schizothecium vesticola]